MADVIHRKTRCAGLSLAMFFFSITGSASPPLGISDLIADTQSLDITFTFSILFTSLEKRYLIANASWLAGSVLTIFLDLFVLAQFAVYNRQDRRRAADSNVFIDEVRQDGHD